MLKNKKAKKNSCKIKNKKKKQKTEFFFLLPIKRMSNAYVITPVSDNVFTLYSASDKKSSDIDLTQLNEAGLHKVLFLFKNKIDPRTLGTIEEFWVALPNTNTMQVNKALSEKMSAEVLREKLKGFLKIWAKETREKRLLSTQIDSRKFKPFPAFDSLHTVEQTTAPNNMQLNVTPFGLSIEPEACASRIVEIQRQMMELEALVNQCQSMASGNDKDACYMKVKTEVERTRTNTQTANAGCAKNAS